MLSRAVNGFTAAQVDAVIRGDYGDPTYRTRVELIDRDGTFIRDITDSVDIKRGQVTHNAKASDIRRQAAMVFRETTVDLDTWLNEVLATAPLFFWRLADTTTTVADASGNGRTATLHGTYTQSLASLTAGDSTNASTSFDGFTGYASIADAAWMDVSAISIAACINTSNAAASKTILARRGATDHFWFRVEPTTGYLSFYFWSGTAQKSFVSTAQVNDGKNHFVVVTYGGHYVRLYVDGIRVLKTAETSAIDAGAIGIGLAALSTGASNFYLGTLDEVLMYNRALTLGEIRTLSQRSADNFDRIDYDTDYIRTYCAVQMTANGTDGTPWAEWPTFTGKLSSPSRTGNETGIYRSCQLSDMSTLLKNNSFGSVYTVSAGENYITGAHGVLAIAQLAGFDTSAWAYTTTALTLPSTIDFALGSSMLDAINVLLLAIDYRPFRFDALGLGVIQPYVLPESRAVEDTFNLDSLSIVLAEIEELTDIDQTSNTVIVSRADPDTTVLRSTATNNDVTSATSTAVTTRAPALTRQIPIVADQTTLDSLGQRFLALSGLATRRLHISTLPRPFHDDEDVITFTDLIAEHALNISKTTIEEEWVLSLDPTQPMTHVLRELDV